MRPKANAPLLPNFEMLRRSICKVIDFFWLVPFG
jgi:hypothetical protein